MDVDFWTLPTIWRSSSPPRTLRCRSNSNGWSVRRTNNTQAGTKKSKRTSSIPLTIWGSPFLDHCGPTALYGTNRGCSKTVRTSWDPKDAARNRPDKIVTKLLSSTAECELLLEKWAELRPHLEREGGFYVGQTGWPQSECSAASQSRRLATGASPRFCGKPCARSRWRAV